MYFNIEVIYLMFFLSISLFGLIPIILFCEYFVRPFRMKQLAHQFGLEYRLQNGWLIFSDARRNILQGKIGENRIQIFDSAAGHGYKPTFSYRSTQLKINSSTYILRGKVSGYYPIYDLKTVLSNIGSTKGKYPIPSTFGPLLEAAKKQWKI
ncbi:MAG: hypothetical protein COZ34_01835 [Candidatus Pacebacteria bacterium CG_4_10_14_3_um_filter_34_15]|nr:hypothetical protein [Candidatus Paceibacterota bacterium]OIO45113.1 MAG: hypothetical protein AUJ41_00625 [Candidatus Pacebacteria bacterium CG1_02_43_31]PIQ81356.1 MAG: hypothetical protein COV78_00480 [Candidatus Pacebacteria bacterium CG11_big_fil_rev_8_21_14_0_20_34_55]PIX81733.1 MAG: hypothetical protein COZ34_01835 [Candidatus Pacebacteria bacterium CG_4_10_14_3_um_filter_34_15]